jgi:hypothetical protein
MGMDVYGRSPTAPVGRYFRANIWSWRPIHALCVELGGDLLGQDMLARMAVNVGAGPADQETCHQLAERFDLWLEHHASGHQVDFELRVTAEGRFVSAEEQAAHPELETLSPYQTDDEHLKEWVTFLRHCGGFAVW